MSTIEVPTPVRTTSTNVAASEPSRARISFRQPVSPAGYIDAAWWPRSRDLTAELPELMAVFWTADRNVDRISYNLTAWAPAPRRLTIEGRTVRLGGFRTSDPLVVGLTDPWRKEIIDIVVIAPETDPEVAERALRLASVADSPYRAHEILARAGSDDKDAT
jgi:hypothetical protein